MIGYGTPALADLKDSREQAAGQAPAVSRALRTLDEQPGVTSAVYYLDAPAPRNNCGPHLFEILNPDPGEPRCVGVNLD